MKYEKLMKNCIELAKKAEGNVSPNPLVGCIVLNSNDKIISKGYHKKYGENHAEREALLKADNSETKGGTLIVNLEPCSHYGKTPPCTDIIIEKKIKKVVIGMRDVNPIVRGNGINKLKEAGIEVIEGILEKDCLNLNEVFIKNMVEHKTFFALKTATTLDGKIATKNGSSKWITSDNARNEVLKIRNRYDAILTSSATIIADNPTMKHRKKIIIDRNLSTDIVNANIYKSGEIYIFYDENIDKNILKITKNKILNKKNIYFYPTKVKNNKIDLSAVADKLYEIGIMSVLVEAGEKLNGSMLEFVDKIYHFMAPKILGDNDGKSCFNFQTALNISEALNFKFTDIQIFEPDILITYIKNNR